MSVADVPAEKTSGSVRGLASRRLGILATQIAILVLILGGWQFVVTDETLPYFRRSSPRSYWSS
jgi:hypothetical protein